jgi:hypothetical protein
LAKPQATPEVAWRALNWARLREAAGTDDAAIKALNAEEGALFGLAASDRNANLAQPSGPCQLSLRETIVNADGWPQAKLTALRDLAAEVLAQHNGEKWKKKEKPKKLYQKISALCETR